MLALKKILYFLPFLSIIAFSFYLFAPVFATTLNSDHAVHVLMSDHVYLPGDLYYWGQDRLGSLLPILTHLFIKIIPVKSITGITVVEFILLFSAFYFLQTFLKNYLSKIILCLILFIPFPAMVPQLYIGHPYVSQFFIISLVLFLTKRYHGISTDLKIKKQSIWFLICVFLLLTVWISDLSLIFVAAFAVAMILQGILCLKKSNTGIMTYIKNFIVHAVIFLMVFLPGMKGLNALKSICYQQPGYSELVNFKTFRKAYSGVYHYFMKSFRLKAGDNVISVYHLAVLIISLVLLFIIIKKIKERKIKFNFYYTVFFSTFFLGYIATLLSNWAFLNTYGARYFIFCYLFLMFLIIFYCDTLSGKLMYILQILFVSGILFYSLRTYEVQKIICLENGTNHSLKEIQDLKQFKDAGIIADYWFSYISCIDSEMNVVATPREGTYVRNPALIDSVFNRKKILLIKNIWLDNFPDTIQQFNRKLYRIGKPESQSNFYYCQYQLPN